MANVDLRPYKRIVQYFWDPEPKNDDTSQSSIWCLGREYRAVPLSKVGESNPSKIQPSKEPLALSNGQRSERSPKRAKATTSDGDHAEGPDTRNDGNTEDRGWPSDFLLDFESRMWLTYRSNFPSIKKSQDPNASATMSLSVRLRSQLVDQGGFTSDTGWGCMIRSGQSLLANALVMLRLGRGWRRGTRQKEEQQLISLFADDPRAPFSIHKFVKHGALACGKHPGEWFGPSATARCTKALSDEYVDTGLKVYITGDGADVYQDTFLKTATADEGIFKPTLILVGIRLGIDRVTPVYWEALKASLQLPHSVGIAGGRPSSSHYFIGLQGDHFFYLDPHQPRPALPFHPDPTKYTVEEIDSCHTRRLRRLSIKDMDPSMLIGFLIRDQLDWEKWRKAIREAEGKPVVHVAEIEPTLRGHGSERESAVDDVETFDDEDEGDGELVERPPA